MKFKKIIILVCLCLFQINLSAKGLESQRSGNVSLYASLLGYGGLYSVGIEFLLTPNLGVNIGYSNVSLEVSDENDVVKSNIDVTFIPMFLSYYVGSGNSRFYVDFGVDYVKVSEEKDFDTFKVIESGSGFFAIAGFGYNYSPIDGGLYFKIGPSIFLNEDGDHMFWGGLTVGYTF